MKKEKNATELITLLRKNETFKKIIKEITIKALTHSSQSNS